MKASMLILLLPGFCLAGYKLNPYTNQRDYYEGTAALHITTGTIQAQINGASYARVASTQTFTGGNTFSLVAVKITTSAMSTDSMCFAGAHAALPTTGYARGCILYLTTDPTKIYISTEAVTKTQSWLAK